MPISAQEHRVRTGLYSSCKGVWLSRHKLKHFSPTTKIRSSKEETECDTTDLQLMWFLATVILLVPLMYTTTMIAITILEVLLQINISTSGGADTVNDVSHRAKLDLNWVIDVCHLVRGMCSWLVQYSVVPAVTILATVISMLVLSLASTVRILKPQTHGVIIVFLGSEIVVFRLPKSRHFSWTVMSVSLVVAIIAAIVTFLTLMKSGDVELNPGPLQITGSTILDVNTHLRPVLETIWDARSQWKEIGIALGLSYDTVRSVHEPSDGLCLHELLAIWMCSGTVTINDLLKALDSRIVDRSDVANEIVLLDGDDGAKVGLDGKVQPISASNRSGDPSRTSSLSLKDLRVVFSDVFPVRPKWYNYGVALKVLPDTLECISIQQRDVPSNCLREVLAARLKMTAPELTWSEIVSALNNPIVGEKKLARKIEKKHFKALKDMSSVLEQQPATTVVFRELTLEELCSLPSVEKVWYSLGLWLGIDEKILQEIRKTENPPSESDSESENNNDESESNDSETCSSKPDVDNSSVEMESDIDSTFSENINLESDVDRNSSSLESDDERNSVGTEDLHISLNQPSSYVNNSVHTKHMFQSFLEYPVGLEKYNFLLGNLPEEMQTLAVEIFENENLEDVEKCKKFIKKTPNELKQIAVDLLRKKSSKTEQLIKALVKVGMRKVAEMVFSKHIIQENSLAKAFTKLWKKDRVSLTAYLSATDSASIAPECVLTYASYLKDRYKQMSVLPDPDWPPALAKEQNFTNLALIKRNRHHLPGEEESETMAYDYAHGDVDKIVARKQNVQLEDIFFPIIDEKVDESRLTILMDGAPGVGKTTLARKMCIDWANGDVLQEYHLVILVPLREIMLSQKQSQAIPDILPTDDLNLKSQVIEHLQGISGAYTLLIFDGFDELTTHQRTRQSLFLDIIKGNTFHRCSVLVTSRPYASEYLRSLRRINRHIEVIGFTKQQIADCIYQNLPHTQANKLLQKLQERLDIDSLCYIPLNCTIILYVYSQHGYELPATLTQLYEFFILHTIKHHAEKITSDLTVIEEIQEATNVHEFPHFVQTQLDNLSQIAYSGIENNKLIFDSKELKAVKNVLSTGLMSSLQCFNTMGAKQHYQFLHLTIQEYLAARYMASDKMSANNKLKFLQSTVEESRFRMTLLFFAGLTHLDFLPTEGSSLGKHDSSTMFLFFAQLAFESNTPSPHRIYSSLQFNTIKMLNCSLSRFDSFVLAQFIYSTPKGHAWKSIDFDSCGLTDDSLEIISRDHAHCQPFEVANTLRIVDQSTPISLDAILPFISHGRFNQVALSVVREFIGIGLTCAPTVKLATALAKNQMLQKLSLDDSSYVISKQYLTDRHHILSLSCYSLQLFLSFIDTEQLKEIALPNFPKAFQDCCCSYCYQDSGMAAVKQLCCVIRKSKCLQILNVSGCKLSPESISFISIALGSVKALSCVNLEGNSISGLSLRTLLNSGDSKTKFFVCGMALFLDDQLLLHVNESPSTVSPQYDFLFQSLAIDTPSTFRGLYLSTSSLVKRFVTHASSIRCLKVFCFRNCKITGELALSLFKILENNQCIEELDISCSNLTEGEHSKAIARAMESMLKANSSLRVLHLRACNLDDRFVYNISNALTQTSLLELDIGENNQVHTVRWIQLFNTFQTLQSLDLSMISLAFEATTALSNVISHTQTLSILRIRSFFVNDDQLNIIVQGLAHNSTLKEIDISNNLNIGSRGWANLFRNGFRSKLLQNINISSNVLGRVGLSALRDFLKRNKMINVFKAKDCSLTWDVLVQCTAILSQRNTNLHTLMITCTNKLTTTYIWEQFFSSLQQNTSLKELYIVQGYPKNKRTLSCSKALSAMLAANKGIKQLTISSDFIEDEHTLIAKALLQNTTLEEFRVGCHYDKNALERQVEKLTEEGFAMPLNRDLKIHCQRH